MIAPGEKLMDVVPDRANLVVAARIAPEDIDDVSLGQRAELRITGMRDRELPLLSAVLTRLSADALVDEKLGCPSTLRNSRSLKARSARSGQCAARSSDFAREPRSRLRSPSASARRYNMRSSPCSAPCAGAAVSIESGNG